MTVNKLLSRKKLSLVSVSLLLLSLACTNNFEAFNTNQHEATEEMMSYDNLKTGAFFTQMQRNVVLFKFRK